MDSVFIVHLTDTHLYAEPGGVFAGVDTDASLRRVMRRLEHDLQARGRQPDLVLVTGDLAEDGTVRAYERLKMIMQAIPAPLAVLPGNHDQLHNFYSVWEGFTGPVVDVRGWRIVLLNSVVPGSSAGHLAPEQLKLLSAASAPADGRHVLVALHHNPITTKAGGNDDKMLSNTRALFAMVGSRPAVKGVVWGHVHRVCERWLMPDGSTEDDPDRCAGGVRLLASPSTCVQFGKPAGPPESLPGYRLLDLLPDGSIHTQVCRADF